MALSPNSTHTRTKRVSLTRPDSKNPGKNSRRPLKHPPRRIHLPRPDFTKYLMSLAVVSVSLFFVVGVCFGLIYTYRLLTTARYFSLRIVEIEGNSRLASRDILEITDLKNGGNTLELSIDRIERVLAQNPWVSEVSVKRVLPSTLQIGLREKTPAFWVLHENSLHYADAWGGLIDKVAPGSFASLPTLEVEPGAEQAMMALPDLVRSLRESRLHLDMADLSRVCLSAARGMELYLEGPDVKIILGLEEWAPNLHRLSATVADLLRRGEFLEVKEIKAQGSNVWVERKKAVSRIAGL